MDDPQAVELLQLTRRLLESITEGNWAVYSELCDDSLTAFEPEAMGQLVQGLEFHHFYFLLGGRTRSQTTLVNPHVRLLGDVALVCYVRLTQRVDGAGQPETSAVEETRVWQRKDGKWKHVHFHRSPFGATEK